MAINEASFTIRVRDQTRLDFESLKEVRMIIMIISMVMVNVMVMAIVMVTVMVMVIVVVKVNFTVVAREVAAGGRESRASVVVHVRDLNDNPPIFLEVNFPKIFVNCDGMEYKIHHIHSSHFQSPYVVSIREDIRPGETVAWVQVLTMVMMM